MTETDVEEQVVDATEQATPRKKRSLLWRISLVSMVAFLTLVIGIIAYGIAFPIEGKLYCAGGSGMSMGLLTSLRQAIAMRSPNTGFVASLQQTIASRAVRFDVLPGEDADPSPDGTEWAWSNTTATAGTLPWPPVTRELVVGGMDGSIARSLSTAAGLAGVNCCPRWSPDGKKIAFQHCDTNPTKDRVPCHLGFQLWVINADGSHAQPITSKATADTVRTTVSAPQADWSPDGSRLVVYSSGMGKSGSAFTMDPDGSNIQVLPDVGMDSVYSPDGEWIASSVMVAGVGDGQPGVWRRLVITRSDGTDPKVLVEQFLPDAEITSRFPSSDAAAWDPKYDWRIDIRYWAGPKSPQWSPSGDMIAFLAAMPFDSTNERYKDQVDVWVFDLSDNRMIKLTDDGVWQRSLLWWK